MKRFLPVKKEFPYDAMGSFVDGNPYTISFVYPQSGEPFVLKGGCNDVRREYILINEPAIIHETYWFHGHSRLNVKLLNLPKIDIFAKKDLIGDEFEGITKKIKWIIYEKDFNLGGPAGAYQLVQRSCYRGTSSGKYTIVLAMRRLPRKWIRELDRFTKKGEKKVARTNCRTIELEEEE
jgi:hypothetical protein